MNNDQSHNTLDAHYHRSNTHSIHGPVSVGEDAFGQRQPCGCQKCRPVHTVEPQDVLAYDLLNSDDINRTTHHTINEQHTSTAHGHTNNRNQHASSALSSRNQKAPHSSTAHAIRAPNMHGTCQPRMDYKHQQRRYRVIARRDRSMTETCDQYLNVRGPRCTRL